MFQASGAQKDLKSLTMC